MTDNRGAPPEQDVTSFYRNDPRTVPLMRGPEDMPATTTGGEAFGAGWRTAQDDWPGRAGDVLNAAYGPVIEAVRAKTGKPMSSYVWIGQGHAGVNEQAVWRDIVNIRARDADFLNDLPADQEGFSKKVTARTIERRQADFVKMSRAEGGAGWARFGGQLAGAASDPFNLMTLPLGGGETIAGRILAQGLIGAVTEAAEQPMVAAERAKRGEKLTFTEGLANVGMAGIGGAAMQGVIVEPLAAIFKRVVGLGRATEDETAALNVLDREAEVSATSPYQPGPGAEAHSERLAAAMAAIGAGDPPTISTRAQLAAGSAMSTPVPRETLPAHADVSRGTTAPMARQQFIAMVRGAESSGNDLAAAETSTAFGRYQFTRGTWLSYYKRRYGAGGLSDAQILAKRANGAIQDQLMGDLTADNAAALARIGASETPGNLYLMHFAGQGGATKVLRAAEGTPVRDLLKPDAIEANAFLKDWTAGELRAWADRKMGGKGEAGPVVRRDLFTDDANGDALWREAQSASEAADLELAAIRRERTGFGEDGEPGIALGRDVVEDGAGVPRETGVEPEAVVGMDWEPAMVPVRAPNSVAPEPPHISEQVAGMLRSGGFADAAGGFSRSVANMAEAGTISDGSRQLILKMDDAGRWLERHDAGLGVVKDVDMRDFPNDPAGALRAVLGEDLASRPEVATMLAGPNRSHLNALEEGLVRERARLADASTEGERETRRVWVAQREREIAGERKYLGLPEADHLDDLSDDDLLAELSGLGEPTNILAGYGGEAGLRDRQAAGSEAAASADTRPLPSSMAIAGQAALRDADIGKATEVARMFDDPHGSASVQMADGLTHDVRQSLDAGELGDVPFALSGVTDAEGGAVPVYEGAAAALGRLDAEDAALAALRACL
ncbi:hypothetical protein HZY97_16265 [Sphingomonas sp. R-74633]|uniref:hypothetical protein n=1 Tax=Sphingomonas sp. R-74633 TaxID=2751188 RepID=UPI0015D20A16|nr:hypothetical protein [Sphingomonas sp. R-74633]NYT42328.1 hypothetical protein [Sphingomonas sp. R-74633]